MPCGPRTGSEKRDCVARPSRSGARHAERFDLPGHGSLQPEHGANRLSLVLSAGGIPFRRIRVQGTFYRR